MIHNEEKKQASTRNRSNNETDDRIRRQSIKIAITLYVQEGRGKCDHDKARHGKYKKDSSQTSGHEKYI